LTPTWANGQAQERGLKREWKCLVLKLWNSPILFQKAAIEDLACSSCWQLEVHEAAHVSAFSSGIRPMKE
jgi:hypothetical protein